jgi:hypothetical protein
MPILGVIDSAKTGNLASNSYFSIASTTVGSGGTPSVTFTDGGAWAPYKHLQIRCRVMSASGTPELVLNFNGVVSSTIYSQHAAYGTGSGAINAYGAGSQTLGITWQGAGGDYTNPAVNIIDLVDFSNTNKHKTFKSLTGRDNYGSGTVSLNSGSFQSNNAISSITLSTTTTVNFAQYSFFGLYGIKG